MSIERIHGSARGRARAVVHNGIAHVVATALSDSRDIAEQTRLTLANLDEGLALAGSDRSRLINATVYLTNMANKQAMDAVWCDWIGGPDNWPQRACVGTDLAGNDMVEIVVTAATIDPAV